MGLYEGTPPSDNRDEQQIRDHMVDKYERKRYYMEPGTALKNGYTPQTYIKPPESKAQKNSEPKPILILSENKPLPRMNGNTNHDNRPSGKNNDFADFDSADIFNSANNNSSTQGFANFDNNPIFNNSGKSLWNILTTSHWLLPSKTLLYISHYENRFVSLQLSPFPSRWFQYIWLAIYKQRASIKRSAPVSQVQRQPLE